jgi:hypothetical protein
LGWGKKGAVEKKQGGKGVFKNYELESRPKNNNDLGWGKKGAVEKNMEANVSSKTMNKRAAQKTATIWVGGGGGGGMEGGEVAGGPHPMGLVYIIRG